MSVLKPGSNIIFSDETMKELGKFTGSCENGKVFLLTEKTPWKLCPSHIKEMIGSKGIPFLVLNGGEYNKSVASLVKVWKFLSQEGADRKSLLINLGGGMITDLGGFAASTFKRGIPFVNIPTTLLSQVDASLGGKTGINFNGLKNEVGVFHEPLAVLINAGFLKTLGKREFLSGYAEMVKHGLIKDISHWKELETFNLEKIDYSALPAMIARSIAVKEWHVENDPYEKNIRKALNFGHTAGHALESLAMIQRRPLLHGYAVAYGMVVELYLSYKTSGLAESDLLHITNRIISWYGKFSLGSSDYEALYDLMTHDKKNEGGHINFTLLSKPGKAEINRQCHKNLIFEALEYYNSASCNK